ncbi:MAG: hypothetical protein FWG35_06985, partial [Spirochaetaceae bacterium]|nr:hypothetical protein [Spirochaetaceae bacterium]
MNKSFVAGGKIAGVCAACFLLVVLARFAAASTLETRGEREMSRVLKELAPGRTFGAREAVSGAQPIQCYYPVLGR